MNTVLKFRRSESSSKPALFDSLSSQTHVYLRKDIHQETRQREGEEEETVWVYQEATMTKDEYIQYQYEKQLLQEDVINSLLENMFDDNEQGGASE